VLVIVLLFSEFEDVAATKPEYTKSAQVWEEVKISFEIWSNLYIFIELYLGVEDAVAVVATVAGGSLPSPASRVGPCDYAPPGTLR
jgi:hypothetical protein